MNDIYNKLLHIKFLSPGDCEILFRMAAKRHTDFTSTLAKIILSHHCGTAPLSTSPRKDVKTLTGHVMA